MNETRTFKKKIVAFFKKQELSLDENQIEIPPNYSLGDYAVPCFIFAKQLKKKPNEIAKNLIVPIEKLNSKDKSFDKIKTAGPYINFFVDKKELTKTILTEIQKQREKYGSEKQDKISKDKENILIEFPAPNTNKPLHLGHLRNIFLSQAVSNILEKDGKTVTKININNDRGIHICKSMLAYKLWGKNKTPKNEKIKSDHFVGDFYVLFANELKKNAKLEEKAQELLQLWEKGDEKTIALWEKMNKWALDGFKETYKRINLKFNKEYYESNIYKKGKKIIFDGLKNGIFQKDESGNIIANLEKWKLNKKVVLRSDGTSVYSTQDIALAKEKLKDFPKTNLSIYVVASEQNFYFKQLEKIFELLKMKPIYHLSYGMVMLPEGKMKSREGTTVDADNILNEMESVAKIEIEKRYNNLTEKEILKRANKIGIGALRFFMLKTDKNKDLTYNPKETIDFNGETGPYLQYTYARINSIKKKYEEYQKNQKEIKKTSKNSTKKTKENTKKTDLTLLGNEEEVKIIKLLGDFSKIVKNSAEKYNPAVLARYLLDLSQAFNEFYHKHQVLNDSNKELTTARLVLCDSIQIVLKEGLRLLEIDVLEEM